MGDANHISSEIEIVPVTLLANLSGLVLLAHCIHPPFYLTRDQVIAQAIPIPAKIPVDNQAPEVYWAEVAGEDKPMIPLHIWQGQDGIGMKGLLDTGADETIIPERAWPSHWELQNVTGKIQGIGGAQLARISKSVLQFEGSDWQLANICPFVADYRVPLWGRDLMSQWGVRTEILKTPRYF